MFNDVIILYEKIKPFSFAVGLDHLKFNIILKKNVGMKLEGVSVS